VRSAIEDHDATLSIHTELAGAFNNRAVCLMQLERLLAAGGDAAAADDARVRAEADLARALALAPELPEACFNAGLLSLLTSERLRARGRLADASERLEQAREKFQATLAHAPSDWAQRRACRAKLAEAEAEARRAEGR
jgi:hypothetical protein